MKIKKIIREEIEEFQWILDITPNKWDIFQDIVKENPNINIGIGSEGEWDNFFDSDGLAYLTQSFIDDNEINPNIKENDMGKFIKDLSKFIKSGFKTTNKPSKDHQDYLDLLKTLEHVNNLPYRS